MPTYRFSIDLALHQSRSVALWIRHNLGSGAASKVIAAKVEVVFGIQQLVIPFPAILIKDRGPELMLSHMLINKIDFGQYEEQVFEYFPGNHLQSPFVFKADEAAPPKFYRQVLEGLKSKIDEIEIGNYDKSTGEIEKYYGKLKNLWLAVYDLVRFFDNVFLILEGKTPCIFNKRFEFSPTRDLFRELPLLGDKTKVIVETLEKYRDKLFEESICKICRDKLIYTPKEGIVSLMCGHIVCRTCISTSKDCIFCHSPLALYKVKVGIPENAKFFEMDYFCDLCDEKLDKESVHHCIYSVQSRESLIKRLGDQGIAVVEPSKFTQDILNEPDDGKIYAISIFERQLAFLLATCYRGYVGLCVCSMYVPKEDKKQERENKDIETGVAQVFFERILTTPNRIINIETPYINSMLKVLRRDTIVKQQFAYYRKTVIRDMQKVTLESKFNNEMVDTMNYDELMKALVTMNSDNHPQDVWEYAMNKFRDEYIVDYINKNIQLFHRDFRDVRLRAPAYVRLSKSLKKEEVEARTTVYIDF